jgi:hypothetical protein
VRRSRVFVLSLLIACAVAPLSARQASQGRPNFSGIWHLVEDRSITRQEGEPVVVSVWPSPLRVRHGRERLIIALDSEQPTARSYRLDGHTTVNKLPSATGERETVSRASWDGDRLVIVERQKGEVDEEETVRRLTLNADGTLTVEAPWGDGGAFVASVYARSR